MLNLTQNQCKNYLLFLGDLTEAVNIIGSQTDSKVSIATAACKRDEDCYFPFVFAGGHRDVIYQMEDRGIFAKSSCQRNC